MKSKVIILSIILAGWIGGSTYYYVCKIKKLCPKKEQLVKETIKPINVTKNVADSSINEKDKNFIDTLKKEEITSNEDAKSKELKEKIDKAKIFLAKGYTVSNFANNQAHVNIFENDFDVFLETMKFYYNEVGIKQINITGYTDSSGNPNKNKILGLERAKFIKKELQKAGLTKVKYILQSEGAANPVASNKSDSGKKQNRRVYITIK